MRTGFQPFTIMQLKLENNLKKKSICLKIKRENWILSWQWGKLSNLQYRITTGSETKGPRDLWK